MIVFTLFQQHSENVKGYSIRDTNTKKTFMIFLPGRGSVGRPMSVARVVERGAETAAVLKRCLYNHHR